MNSKLLVLTLILPIMNQNYTEASELGISIKKEIFEEIKHSEALNELIENHSVNIINDDESSETITFNIQENEKTELLIQNLKESLGNSCNVEIVPVSTMRHATQDNGRGTKG